MKLCLIEKVQLLKVTTHHKNALLAFIYNSSPVSIQVSGLAVFL